MVQRLEDGAVKAFQPIWSQSNNLVQQQRTSSQPHQTSPQERQKKMLDTVTVSESRSLQSFQHTPQRVQFQELPVSASNGGVKEEPPVDLIMPHQVRVSSPHRQQLNSPPVSPHRNLMHSPPVPDFPYAREGPAALAWGVVPAPRTTEDSPGSRIPYPPSADVQELQTYSESRPHRDDVGSIASHESEQERQGDVQLSQRPGIVTSRTIPGAGAYLNISSYTSSAGNDVSFRNRAPVMASSYQALPPHFPPAMPQGQFSHHHVPWQPYSGLSMYPGPSPMPLRMPFNSNTWGHGW